MKNLADLSEAIDRGSVYSEARAMLDYTAHGAIVCEWIVSHEILRRRCQSLASQRDAMQRENSALRTSLSQKTAKESS